MEIQTKKQNEIYITDYEFRSISDEIRKERKKEGMINQIQENYLLKWSLQFKRIKKSNSPLI